jgi:hypothetical protein
LQEVICHPLRHEAEKMMAFLETDWRQQVVRMVSFQHSSLQDKLVEV